MQCVVCLFSSVVWTNSSGICELSFQGSDFCKVLFFRHVLLQVMKPIHNCTSLISGWDALLPTRGKAVTREQKPNCLKHLMGNTMNHPLHISPVLGSPSLLHTNAFFCLRGACAQLAREMQLNLSVLDLFIASTVSTAALRKANSIFKEKL